MLFIHFRDGESELPAHLNFCTDGVYHPTVMWFQRHLIWKSQKENTL